MGIRMAITVAVDVVIAVVHVVLAQRMSGQPARRQLCGRGGEAALAPVAPEFPDKESSRVNVVRVIVLRRLHAAIGVRRTAIVSFQGERRPVRVDPSG